MATHVWRETNPGDPMTVCCVVCGVGECEVVDKIVPEHECLGRVATGLRRRLAHEEARKRFAAAVAALEVSA